MKLNGFLINSKNYKQNVDILGQKIVFVMWKNPVMWVIDLL
jgi:hypothetical protein